ncbi:MAG TPA: hypothetical protein PLL69_10685 [Gemmatimonadales bacterium]|nr:hypothetical protein [Gemmatimonadales bacterium]
MRFFRQHLLRTVMTLAWFCGTGALSAEAMLPDVHESHQHADIDHLQSVNAHGAESDGGGSHQDGHACHCTHVHTSGLATASFEFRVSASWLSLTVPAIPAIHSLSITPPHHPPRV